MNLATPWRAALVALVALVAVVAPSRGADAHRNDESYLYLDVGTSSLSGRVELPYRDVRQVFGLQLEGTVDEVLGELEANLATLQDYALSETAIGTGDVRWPLAFDGVEVLFDDDVPADGLGYVILPFTVELSALNVPRDLEVTFTPFLDEIADRNNIVLVANDWQRGVIEQETNELLVLSRDAPGGSVDLGDPSQWRNFTASVELGADHIRTGPDHVFFVLVLLLPSVLVLVLGTWRPAAGFGQSLIRIVLVATMFTIAHSITFTLAGLDILPLPPAKLVETLIALSIAAAALHNLKPIFGHREWALAFVFGLFHGMGFAGLVEELDIDRTTQLVSLLGRNVGIEIAQLIIIVLVFPALFILRRTRVYMPMFYVTSVGLAIVSALWIVERVAEVDLNITGAVNRTLEWPRSLYVAIALTVVAAAYRAIEERRGRLLPVGRPGAEPAAADEGVDDVEPAPTGA